MAGFFVETGFDDWFSMGIPIFHCVYEQDKYHDGLYFEYGIAELPTLNQAVPKRRAEFLAGRFCAGQALRQLGCENINVGIGANRKPVWPAGVTGSISHTQCLAAAFVVSADRFAGIGVDVEHIVADDMAIKLRKQVLSDQEYSRLNQITGSVSHTFTIAFSVKESFFKATFDYVGKYFDFNSVTLEYIDLTNGFVHLVVSKPLAPGLYVGRRLDGKFRFLNNETVATAITFKQV